MKLDKRLQAVEEFVEIAKGDAREWTHIDIGTDHGHLLLALLEQSTITQAIAVEKNEAPLNRTQKALRGFNAQFFLGDGFEPLEQGIADIGDSASICGLGANTILQILQAFPEKLPKILILQANKQSEKLRRWGYEQGYHLIDEQMVDGFWNYVILLFEQKTDKNILDPSYTNLADATLSAEFSVDTQLRYGPHLLKRRNPLLLKTIQSELEHFATMEPKNAKISAHIRDLEQILKHFL